MRNLIFLIYLLPILLQGSPISDSFSQHVDQIGHAFIERNQVPTLLIGIITQDPKTQEIKQQIFSYGTLPAEKRPRSDALFRIASITKVFTATLLAKFVEEGIVKLDEPVQRYLPQVTLPSYGERQITFLDLVTHTSGLPRMPRNFRNYATYSVEDMFRFLSHYQLEYPPGERFLYSNLGFALLGQALQAAGGKRWEALIVEEICNPLQMPDTRAILTTAQKERVVKGHVGNHLAPINGIDLHSAPFMSAGGLFSTLNDMLKFLAYNMDLHPTHLTSLLPLLQQPRRPMPRAPNQVSLGWQHMILEPYNHIFSFNKDGGLGGYTSFISFVKESKTGVIVLCNKNVACSPVGEKVLRLLNLSHSVAVLSPVKKCSN